MKAVRLAAAAAAAVLLLATPGIANAATITQRFQADSGDSCRYGSTEGDIVWQTGITSPLPLLRVLVAGSLTDRPVPLPTGPALCRDDGYNSTVSFVAYSGAAAVDRQYRTADNGTVEFKLSLGSTAIKADINRVVVQVCRDPIFTLPPSYCGKPVTYLAPPIAGPLG